ncbi:MAG TPA: aminotransferase class III-fold pyridoxal phosphate-dependent enzyme, partial [Polyangiaceae bacterium]|nr:aminotransferase class III-fold pyridoxal phosphate-dependent enzyme [Polyangiaceae bacterium]
MDPTQRAQLIARDKNNVWHPYTQMSLYQKGADPLLIVSANGARLREADGRSILDGNSSWWTSLLGHNHPRLVEALTHQARQLCHTSLGGVTHQPAIEFAESFAAVCPPGLGHIFFSDNGSTAVEAAPKMAIQFWHQQPQQKPHKHEFLALRSAFHGETMGATALCDVGAFQAPFAAARRPATRVTSPADDLGRALDELEKQLRTRADHIAALIVEPLIQGAGGMKMYEPSYLLEARRLTEKYDVLLIVDEVFTGYGRTGRFWACDHAGISPDILCAAKGLSGGVLPFAATATSDRVFESFLGDRSRAFMYGHTFCGNPLGAAVGREVLKIYEDEHILEGTQERSRLIAASVERLA